MITIIQCFWIFDFTTVIWWLGIYFKNIVGNWKETPPFSQFNTSKCAQTVARGVPRRLPPLCNGASTRGERSGPIWLPRVILWFFGWFWDVDVIGEEKGRTVTTTPIVPMANFQPHPRIVVAFHCCHSAKPFVHLNLQKSPQLPLDSITQMSKVFGDDGLVGDWHCPTSMSAHVPVPLLDALGVWWCVCSLSHDPIPLPSSSSKHFSIVSMRGVSIGWESVDLRYLRSFGLWSVPESPRVSTLSAHAPSLRIGIEHAAYLGLRRRRVSYFVALVSFGCEKCTWLDSFVF